jgi:hypothetical protein
MPNYAARNVVTRFPKPLFRHFCVNKNYRDRKRNRGDHAGLYRTVMSEEVFFGECLIVVARKTA